MRAFNLILSSRICFWSCDTSVSCHHHLLSLCSFVLLCLFRRRLLLFHMGISLTLYHCALVVCEHTVKHSLTSALSFLSQWYFGEAYYDHETTLLSQVYQVHEVSAPYFRCVLTVMYQQQSTYSELRSLFVIIVTSFRASSEQCSWRISLRIWQSLRCFETLCLPVFARDSQFPFTCCVVYRKPALQYIEFCHTHTHTQSIDIWYGSSDLDSLRSCHSLLEDLLLTAWADRVMDMLFTAFHALSCSSSVVSAFLPLSLTHSHSHSRFISLLSDIRWVMPQSISSSYLPMALHIVSLVSCAWCSRTVTSSADRIGLAGQPLVSCVHSVVCILYYV